MKSLLIQLNLYVMVLAILVGSCSTSTSLENEELTVVNNTSNPIVYAFTELDADHQEEIDPHPFKVSSENERLLQPEASVISTVKTISKENMGRILIWEVKGDSAFIKRGLTFTGKELKQRGYRVEIEEHNVSCVGDLADEQAASAQDTLFSVVSDPRLSSEQKHWLSVIWNRPTTMELHTARLADNAASLLEEGRAIRLDTSPSHYAIAVGEQVERRAPDDISWSGDLQNDYGSATLVLTGKGVTGSLQRWNDGNALNFKFEPIGNGLQALICVDTDTYLED